MTPQELADMIADDLRDSDPYVQTVRMTPSVVATRHFLGIVTEDGEEFLVTVEKV